MSSYIMHHKCSDGSSWVLPLIIDERDKHLIKIVLESINTFEVVEFVKVEPLHQSKENPSQ